VDLLVDEELKASLSDPPYFGIIFDTTALTDGLHSFKAVAVDGMENSSVTSVVARVDNTAPAVCFVDPWDGDIVAGNIELKVHANDGGSGIAAIEVLAGGVPPTVDPSTTFSPQLPTAIVTGQEDTTRHSDGSLVLSALAIDGAGNEAFTMINVEVDNTAPGKSIQSPSDGEVVSGVIPIFVAAEDVNLDFIEIYVGGELLGSGGTSPFILNFDTRTRLDGEVVVSTRVRDLSGNTSTCSVTVVVDNVSVKLTPVVLNLEARGKGKIMAHLSGPNLELLIPTEEKGIRLIVPGGNPVSSEIGFAGDDTVMDNRLEIRFDRQELVNSIRAGMAVGEFQIDSHVPIDLIAGEEGVIGSVLLRIKGTTDDR
jgi:hypothetical protein